MTRRAAWLGALALVAPAGAAAAQDATAVEQISGARRPAAAAQISGAAAPLSTGPAQRVDRSFAAAPAPTTASRPAPERQLTAERGRTDAGTQLTAGAPDPGPAPSAAQRQAGRNTRVDRPGGPDRCDPQRRDGRPAEVCARVIETRAGDFPAPDPEPLSAEQRLLVTQRELNPASRDVGSAARRLADGDIDESNAALAVASMTLGQGVRPDEDEEETPADTSVTDAIVAGVLAAIGQNPTP